MHTAHTLANLEYGFKRKLLGILYRKGRVIPVAISVHKKSIIDVYCLLDNRVELIYNAVDVNRFQAPSRDGKGNIVIGHVGRLEPSRIIASSLQSTETCLKHFRICACCLSATVPCYLS